MIQLQLTPAQAEMLQRTLKQVLADMSYEIANTDAKDYRDVLKEQRERLREVVVQLGGEGREGAALH